VSIALRSRPRTSSLWSHSHIEVRFAAVSQSGLGRISVLRNYIRRADDKCLT
jgi:hypothetical protein